ncbi:MAG: diaminopimelate epimerase [Clostridiales bacterium]|nr:diaminopimelate epimerase [Clostridiales bacterium]
MKFTKMHGAGNDYIYVNCFEEKIADRNAVAKKISDRHFGIGSDGLICIEPSDVADFKMDMYNSDGSQGKMCGNATRCVAKYVFDNGMTDKEEISLETLSGIKYIKVKTENNKVVQATVNMGEPILTPKEIPVNVGSSDIVLGEKITIDGKNYEMTCVSMGNPHCVVYVDDVDDVNIEKVGPLFENCPLFPDRINTEFIQRIDSETIKMRVWERGAGETLACGTGACASVVATVLNEYAKKDSDVKVILRGGELTIRWDSESNNVFMTGPAQTVFTGEIDV